MNERINLSKLAEMVEDPDVPFSLDMLERATLIAFGQFEFPSEEIVKSFRNSFAAVRTVGENTEKAVTRAMTESMCLESRVMSEEDRLIILHGTIEPCARATREQAERRMTNLLFRKLSLMTDPVSG